MKTKTVSRTKFLENNVKNIKIKKAKSTNEMKEYGACHGKPNKIEKL